MITEIIRSSYMKLPQQFYQEVAPTPIATPCLVKFNHDLAACLGIEHLSSSSDVSIYAGNFVPSHLSSIALAYAGDQFGHHVPLLGDGRAVLLGEVCSPDNKRWDIQLKGSGKTRFSRQGDGRAPLSAVLREYLISEAMHGLGISTTRCLAVIASDDYIYRQNGPVPIGVLTRVAASYLRVGSFQFAADQNDPHLIKYLADYALERHYPDLLNHATPYLELFKGVVDGQARLIADWMGVGFIHGVMNTDNMAISGETIDYGPCAFMDEFNANCVFSSIDVAGRYAFNNQAYIAHWNLAKFMETLLPLFSTQEALYQLQNALDSFSERFNYYWSVKIRHKMGLFDDNETTSKLISRFIVLLQQYKPDFTNTFRQLCEATNSEYYQQVLLEGLGSQANSRQWITDWVDYIKQQNIDMEELKQLMYQANPAYIPRNHLVEKAITNYIEKKDASLIDSLLAVCSRPYHQQKNTDILQRLPLPHERIHQTFCGT